MILRIFVAKLDACLLGELSLEVNEEVDLLVLEDVRQRIGIGNDTFNHIFIENKLELAYNWRQGVCEELDDFSGRIFAVRNKDGRTFAFLCTA